MRSTLLYGPWPESVDCRMRNCTECRYRSIRYCGISEWSLLGRAEWQGPWARISHGRVVIVLKNNGSKHQAIPVSAIRVHPKVFPLACRVDALTICDNNVYKSLCGKNLPRSDRIVPLPTNNENASHAATITIGTRTALLDEHNFHYRFV